MDYSKVGVRSVNVKNTEPPDGDRRPHIGMENCRANLAHKSPNLSTVLWIRMGVQSERMAFHSCFSDPAERMDSLYRQVH